MGYNMSHRQGTRSTAEPCCGGGSLANTPSKHGSTVQCDAVEADWTADLVGSVTAECPGPDVKLTMNKLLFFQHWVHTNFWMKAHLILWERCVSDEDRASREDELQGRMRSLAFPDKCLVHLCGSSTWYGQLLTMSNVWYFKNTIIKRNGLFPVKNQRCLCLGNF